MKFESNFYVTKGQATAANIQLIFCEDATDAIAAMPSKEQAWLANQNIEGCADDMCCIFNDIGVLIKVVFFDSNKTRHLSLAKMIPNLPAGTYQLVNEVDNEILLSWGKAQYRFEHYKEFNEGVRQLIVSEPQHSWLNHELAMITLTRDLINTPTNDMGPTQLADVVRTVAGQYDAEYEEHVGEALLKNNYPAIHAVGRAAADAPRLTCLHWGEKNAPHIAIVGKGVCFDSGGLDLKPSKFMRLMKKDMGGAANAIGLASWIMASKLPVRLSLYISAVENAVGAGAFRPGDVITMRNGLTVEIDNTDAEGRLVLADAITYACESKPEMIIDLATLTGAARAAVGTDIAAMFSNDDALARSIEAHADKTFDPVCRLPLYDDYEPMLNSSIADIANSTASSYAGAITAALFLQRFVENNTSWVHFDIMAWNPSSKPGKPEGGEAMAVRALGQYLLEKYGR